MAGEPDGGSGEGAAAGQDEGGLQIVLLHVAACGLCNITSGSTNITHNILHQRRLQLGSWL